jgi:potassium/chloride transporter 4/5/6
MCVLGKRLLKDISINDCHKRPFGPLHQIFCVNSSSESAGSCDPYFEANDVSKVRGIKGLSSGVFLGKLYTNKDQDYDQVVISTVQFEKDIVYHIFYMLDTV